VGEPRTRRPTTPGHPVLGTPLRGLSTTGPLATAQWLVQRELAVGAPPRWFVDVAFVVPGRDTKLQLEIYSDEWGVRLRHDGRESWIRITDVAFVHGRDDYQLLRRIPRLSAIGDLITTLERELGIRFDREHISVETNLSDEPRVRAWATAL
jgi:hypothetical protein